MLSLRILQYKVPPGADLKQEGARI